LPVVFADTRAFLSALSRPDEVAPGLGLANFILYCGVENEPAVRVLFAAVPLIALAVVALLLRFARVDPAGQAALAALLVLFLLPTMTPEAVSLPILLAALPFVRSDGAR
jgi:hypothetical protein